VNPAGLRPSGLVVVLSCWSCPLPNPGGAEARTAVDLAPSSRLGGPCPFYPDGPPATRLQVKAHRPRPPCFHCSARTRMPWRRQRLVSSLLREPPPPRGAPSSTTSRRSVPASVTNWTRPPAPLTLTDPPADSERRVSCVGVGMTEPVLRSRRSGGAADRCQSPADPTTHSSTRPLHPPKGRRVTSSQPSTAPPASALSSPSGRSKTAPGSLTRRTLTAAASSSCRSTSPTQAPSNHARREEHPRTP